MKKVIEKLIFTGEFFVDSTEDFRRIWKDLFSRWTIIKRNFGVKLSLDCFDYLGHTDDNRARREANNRTEITEISATEMRVESETFRAPLR